MIILFIYFIYNLCNLIKLNEIINACPPVNKYAAKAAVEQSLVLINRMFIQLDMLMLMKEI